MRCFPFTVVLATAGCLLLAGTGFAQGQKATSAQMPVLSLKVGDTAPDFTLRDQTGKEVSLKDFRGNKSVVLAFYVFAFTGG
jgi:cytochrome oxidase Cu insertion factor (SCO1/SenC/PrrC family)